MQEIKATTPELQQLLSETVDLVSMPEVYLKIRQLMDDPSSDIENFAKIISTDPNLVGTVLRIVNSALYGFSGQIGTIARALNFIGIRQLHDLVLSVSAVSSFTGIPNDIIDMRLFWRRSVLCGVLSSLLAKECGIKDSERLFVIGLLHEIGHLVLFSRMPDKSRQVLEREKIEDRPLYQIEQELLGFHYAQLGQELMKIWKLPESFQDITRHHVKPSVDTPSAVESSVVHIAHAFAHAKESDQIEDVTDPVSWQISKIALDEIDSVVNDANEKSAAIYALIIGQSAA